MTITVIKTNYALLQPPQVNHVLSDLKSVWRGVCVCFALKLCAGNLALISAKPQCRLAPVAAVNAAFELLIEP